MEIEHVIQNILNLSRLEDGGRQYQYESFRIDALLEEVLDDYQTTLTAYEIEIKRELPVVKINSDKEMLFIVFSNLVNNSIKYRRNQGPANIRVYLEKNEDIITVRIIDNGIGMTEVEHQQAFERFYQVSASTEGSGIGLNISKLIVNGLGGRIWLESSEKGEGTVAVVELPVSPKI